MSHFGLIYCMCQVLLLCKVCGRYVSTGTGRVCYVVLLIVDEHVQKAGVWGENVVKCLNYTQDNLGHASTSFKCDDQGSNLHRRTDGFTMRLTLRDKWVILMGRTDGQSCLAISWQSSMNYGGNGTLNSRANACILLKRSTLPPVMR